MENFARAKSAKLNEIIFQIKKYELQDAIIVAGSPRSGTTWLAEVLSSTYEYAMIFEPLHPVRFPEAARSGFYARTYLPAGKTWITGEKYLEKVFTGGVSSARFEGMENFKNAILSHKLIVKFVRVNRLLPWLSEKFNVRQIILLVRHPCAVVASQLQSGHYGYNDIFSGHDICPEKEKIIHEAEKIDCIDGNIIKKIERIETPEEALATIWCLDNYVPLTSPQKSRWILVPYEKLMMDKTTSIKNIADMCGIVCSKKHMEYIAKPSRVASNDLKAVNIQQLSKWKNHLSNDQITRILNIVSAFGLDFYTDAVLPDYKGHKIGQNLLVKCLRYYIQNNILSISVNTQKSNSPSLALYKKLKFEDLEISFPVYRYTSPPL